MGWQASQQHKATARNTCASLRDRANARFYNNKNIAECGTSNERTTQNMERCPLYEHRYIYIHIIYLYTKYTEMMRLPPHISIWYTLQRTTWHHCGSTIAESLRFVVRRWCGSPVCNNNGGASWGRGVVGGHRLVYIVYNICCVCI